MPRSKPKARPVIVLRSKADTDIPNYLYVGGSWTTSKRYAKRFATIDDARKYLRKAELENAYDIVWVSI